MKSYPFIIQKYTYPIIPLSLAKSWLELDIAGYEGKDPLIEACIKSAIASVESDCNFQLGLSTYKWNVDWLPCEMRDTFYVKSIESVHYRGGDTPDIDGYSLIDPANYELIQVSKRRSIIEWDCDFKVTAKRFRVTFKAGFEEGKVPEDLLQAVRARLGEFYSNGGDAPAEKRTLSQNLLIPFIIGYAG